MPKGEQGRGCEAIVTEKVEALRGQGETILCGFEVFKDVGGDEI